MVHRGDGCCFPCNSTSGEKKHREIPCWRENQPGGCQQAGCPFRHTKERDVDGLCFPPNKKEEPVLPLNHAEKLGKRKASTADVSGLPLKHSRADTGDKKTKQKEEANRRRARRAQPPPNNTIKTEGSRRRAHRVQPPKNNTVKTEGSRRRARQVQPPGDSTVAGSSGRAGKMSDLGRHLLQSIEELHPLGQRVKAVGPARQPPSVQPCPGAPGIPTSVRRAPPAAPASSTVPAAPQLPASNKDEAAPSGSRTREGDAANKTAPKCLPPSPLRSPTLQQDLPRWLCVQQPALQARVQQPSLQRCRDYVPCMGPWQEGCATPTPLEEQEESLPITPEQWPEQDYLKKLAQQEREQAVHHMKIGPVQFLVQRERDMAIDNYYGYQ